MDSNKLENLFEILGIKDKNPSWNKIKFQYRKKVLETHPDMGGNAKEFIKIYEVYQLIKEKYSPQKMELNEEKGNLKRKEPIISKEMIKEIQEIIFSKYIVPEIDYFLKKMPNSKKDLLIIKGEKENKFKENVFEDFYLISESDIDLLKGELFGLNFRSLDSSFEEVMSKKPFDKELFQKYVLLTKAGEALSAVIPLNGRNIRGLELIIDLSSPQKWRRTNLGDNYSFVNIFGKEWVAEDIITNLRVGNYREHFKGYRELYSTPLLDLNKEGEIGFDIRTISKFIQKMLMDFDSKNFELELSRKLPEGHPYNKPQYNLYYNKEHDNSDKYGFYINNLMLGDLKVIVNGAPQEIKEYFRKLSVIEQ